MVDTNLGQNEPLALVRFWLNDSDPVVRIELSDGTQHVVAVIEPCADTDYRPQLAEMWAHDLDEDLARLAWNRDEEGHALFAGCDRDEKSAEAAADRSWKEAA